MCSAPRALPAPEAEVARRAAEIGALLAVEPLEVELGAALVGLARDGEHSPLLRRIEAVRSLHLGQRFLCNAASASMAESVTQELLTGREREVLALMSQGLDNKSIALRLDIALGTVKSHVKAVLAKMAARSRTQAVAVARQRGLVQDTTPGPLRR